MDILLHGSHFGILLICVRSHRNELMVRPPKNHDSEGEDFNFKNDGFTSSEDSSEAEIVEDDTWQLMALGEKPKRSEYEKASESTRYP
jgi:hypothetical protein